MALGPDDAADTMIAIRRATCDHIERRRVADTFGVRMECTACGHEQWGDAEEIAAVWRNLNEQTNDSPKFKSTYQGDGHFRIERTVPRRTSDEDDDDDRDPDKWHTCATCGESVHVRDWHVTSEDDHYAWGNHGPVGTVWHWHASRGFDCQTEPYREPWRLRLLRWLLT